MNQNQNEELTPRKLVRVAQKIREQLQSLVQTRTRAVILRTEVLYTAQAQLKSLRRQLQVALARGWNAAADKLARRIALVVRDLPMYSQNVERLVEARGTITVPFARCLLDDLQQLKNELDGLRYHAGQSILAVTTESITLEDVYLGPFEIQLFLNSLARDEPHSAYEIVALDPHPAGCNSDVTHPHVSDQRLCAGDAVTPIGAALSSGRICDFFLLVRSVLTTYNSGSPYVSLDDWHGSSCYDCSYTIASDDCRWCSACDHDFCGECASYCHVCDETICNGCLEECPACDEHVCPSCLTRCPDCGDPICKNCLQVGGCPCKEEEECHEDEQDNTTAVEAGTAADAAA
jgi:hypothetical protein